MAVNKPWGLFPLIRLTCMLLFSLSAGLLVRGLLETLTFFKTHEMALKIILSALSFHGAALICIHYFLRDEKLSWRAAFFEGPLKIWRLLLLGAVIACLALPITWWLQNLGALVLTHLRLQPELQPVVKHLQNEFSTHSSSVYRIFFFCAAVLLAPVVEELLFRGILYPALKNSVGKRHALVLTSLLFAAIHTNLQAFLPLFFLAMIFTVLYEETGHLLAPMMAHCCFNLAGFVVVAFEKPLSRFFTS